MMAAPMSAGLALSPLRIMGGGGLMILRTFTVDSNFTDFAVRVPFFNVVDLTVVFFTPLALLRFRCKDGLFGACY